MLLGKSWDKSPTVTKRLGNPKGPSLHKSPCEGHSISRSLCLPNLKTNISCMCPRRGWLGIRNEPSGIGGSGRGGNQGCWGCLIQIGLIINWLKTVGNTPVNIFWYPNLHLANLKALQVTQVSNRCSTLLPHSTLTRV